VHCSFFLQAPEIRLRSGLGRGMPWPSFQTQLLLRKTSMPAMKHREHLYLDRNSRAGDHGCSAPIFTSTEPIQVAYPLAKVVDAIVRVCSDTQCLDHKHGQCELNLGAICLSAIMCAISLLIDQTKVSKVLPVGSSQQPPLKRGRSTLREIEQ
jgi:hypothetical protein